MAADLTLAAILPMVRGWTPGGAPGPPEERAVTRPTPDWPRVSVVIPVRNEGAFIGRNLEAALAQDYPADKLEILVADGMSEDATREVVLGIAQRLDAERAMAVGDRAPRAVARVRLVDNPRRIMPTGTNAAIRRAGGDVIVLLGGHAQLPPDYIRRCVACLIETDADGVSGSLASVGDGPVGEAIAAAMSSPFGIGNSDFRTAESGDSPRTVDTIPFGAYRRRLFERIGLFNPAMVRHQDYEFNYRARQSGGRLLLLPGLKANYHVRSSLGALWKQYAGYGLWKGRFLRRFPRSIQPRHMIPPLFTLGVVLSGLASLVFPPARLVFALMGGAYLGFVLLGMATFAARGMWNVVPWLPAVMVCLHFSYGLGIWPGLLMPPVTPAPRLTDPEV